MCARVARQVGADRGPLLAEVRCQLSLAIHTGSERRGLALLSSSQSRLSVVSEYRGLRPLPVSSGGRQKSKIALY
jgi:hypothetical protein